MDVLPVAVFNVYGLSCSLRTSSLSTVTASVSCVHLILASDGHQNAPVTEYKDDHRQGVDERKAKHPMSLEQHRQVRQCLQCKNCMRVLVLGSFGQFVAILSSCVQLSIHTTS